MTEDAGIEPRTVATTALAIALALGEKKVSAKYDPKLEKSASHWYQPRGNASACFWLKNWTKTMDIVQK